MQPRGQLWFELARVCQDFRDFSGLETGEALRVMIAVLQNLLADTEAEYEKLVSGEPPSSETPPAS